MRLRVLFLAALAAAVNGPAWALDATPASPAPTPPVQAEPSHEEVLDGLYRRLATAANPQAAASIVGFIEDERLKSGSATANLLMARAMAATQGAHADVGLSILDKLVGVRPEWAVAWSRRAALRLTTGDVGGAMADIAETLKRDPRDLTALGGLAAVLTSEKRYDEAEAVYQKALALAPAYEPLVAGEKRVKAAIAAHSL